MAATIRIITKPGWTSSIRQWMTLVGTILSRMGYRGKVFSKDISLLPPVSRELYNRADVFGTITGSTFSGNYFGGYTFGAYCMDVNGNNFTNNLWYGFDPHDDSDYITVTNNSFNGNQGHGLICSVYCDHMVISNNTANNNGGNGIMIHRHVDGAVIQGNTANGNLDSGLGQPSISSNATVSGNIFSGNGNAAIRLSVGASYNTIFGNTLTGTTGSGNGYVIYSFQGSDPTSETTDPQRITGNMISGNTIQASKPTVIKLSESAENVIADNSIQATSGSRTFEFKDGVNNTVRGNTLNTTMSILTRLSAAPAAFTNLVDLTVGSKANIQNLPGSSTASAILTDTRGYVWDGGDSQNPLVITAAPGGTSATIASLEMEIDVRPLTIIPATGALDVGIDSSETSGAMVGMVLKTQLPTQAT